MQDLNGMRVFVQVAEARSFSAAGKRLGLTSSAVSKAVQRMEQEFGLRLFNRTTRSVGLTQDGAAFFERCRHVLADLEEAETQLTQSALRPRGRLRVHMPTAFGRRVVLPVLARRLADVPDLQVDIELGERVVDPIEEGLDAVIRFGEPPDSALIARRLCDVRFVACAAPGYLKRFGEPATPVDLAQHTCLGYVTPWTGHYREWRFREGQRDVMRNVSGQLNINNAEALLNAALEGAGIAMVADFVAYEAIRSGELKLLLPGFLGRHVPVSVLYLPLRERTPRLRWFLDMLHTAIPSPAPWTDLELSNATQAD